MGNLHMLGVLPLENNEIESNEDLNDYFYSSPFSWFYTNDEQERELFDDGFY